MSLCMYLGEVTKQTQSMNSFCIKTIQGMEQAIQSIDTFVCNSVLQGKTYDTAKVYFANTYRPLAQGIIYLCEELIRQNDNFPKSFQSQVASTDVIEREIREQINDIDRMLARTEIICETVPSMQVMVNIYKSMKNKLMEKLEHLYQYNYTSRSNYDTAIQLANSIAQGLAEVQSEKGFNRANGTFSTQTLNMEWTTSIQKITERKSRNHDKKTKSLIQIDDKNKINYFTGKAEWKNGDRVGAVLEGSVVNGKESLGKYSEWNMKALTGKIDVNFPYSIDAAKEDLMAGNIIGAKIEASALENSFKTTNLHFPIIIYIGGVMPIRVTPKEVTITQKFGEGNFTTGVEKYTATVAAELTTNKYEAELNLFHIPDFIPLVGDCDVIAKGEVGLGTFGFKAKIGSETGGYFGEEVGFGGFIKFEKPKEEGN